MKKRVLFGLLAALVLVGGCAKKEAKQEEVEKERKKEPVEISVFAAKSLNKVMDELYLAYQEEHEEVSFVPNYDSSGTLMTQIEEGADCDIFFSAAMKQMDELEEKGFVVEDTRKSVVNNQVCLVTYDGSQTKVKDLKDLNMASNMALADGSVPVGKYTRQALMNAGILQKVEDVSMISTAEVSEALGGLEINECANVGVVVAAVAEGGNEVGTVYYSDMVGFEDKLDIIQVLPYELTGNVIYPVAAIKQENRNKEKEEVMKDFIEFLKSEKAKKIFEDNHFDTDV